MVPDNIVGAASDNRRMLNIVFLAFLFGVALMLIPKEQSAPMLALFESLNAVIIKIVELVILFAPIGVFGLIADTVTGVAADSPADVPQLLAALGFYGLAVLIGLAIQMFMTYPLLLRLFTPLRLRQFFAGVVQAQLVAFSTSSSAATLPVTMKSAQKNLGISEEVASFVLPLGATINMDGTALYQAVAAVFIAQTLGIPLDLTAQLSIVFLALLASIGTAAVPSAGLVMLIVILETINVPAAGIALILGVDRPLDMARTAANITGDVTVAAIVAAGEGQLAPVGAATDPGGAVAAPSTTL
jgi:Na+/H+-dicarboxylate symporter